MKKTMIAIIFATVIPATAFATGVNQTVGIDVHTYSKAQASAQAKAQASAFGLGVGYGGAGGNSTATTGNSTATGGTSTATGGDTTVNMESGHHPVNSAIAPSVGTGDDCQIATPSSLAGGILIISLSGTTGVHYNDICYAYKRGQFDVADRMMCDKSAAYAKANSNCKK